LITTISLRHPEEGHQFSQLENLSCRFLQLKNSVEGHRFSQLGNSREDRQLSQLGNCEEGQPFSQLKILQGGRRPPQLKILEAGCRFQLTRRSQSRFIEPGGLAFANPEGVDHLGTK
jgi:hypothetical protein